MTSILTALNAGAGIDSKAVVTELAAAARAGRDKTLLASTTSNSAKISTLATISASISEFATAFDTDVQDDTISTAKLINEFVTGFNQLRAMITAAIVPGATPGASGALLGDAGLRAASSALSQLPLRALPGGTTAQSLNDLGISTNRNGSLSIDRVKLNVAIAADPVGIRAMLAGTNGLDAALTSVSTLVTGERGIARSQYDPLHPHRDDAGGATGKGRNG